MFVDRNFYRRKQARRMEQWAQKTAVVTGASAGIGAAICVGLANAGLRVVGLARRPELVEDLKSQVTGKGSIHGRKCDIANQDEIASTFKWIEDNFEGVDIIVNNAGLFHRGFITDLGGSAALNDESMNSLMDVNYKGLVFCTRQAIASMKKRNFDGHVININSIAGHYIPFAPLFNVYSSTKYAVTAFTSALANELAQFKSRIKVTSLSPGLVKTALAGDSVDLVDFTALEPQDVADAVLYVVSTPPNVNISELTIQPVAEKRL